MPKRRNANTMPTNASTMYTTVVTCIPHRTLKVWKIRFGTSLKTWFGIFSNIFEMLCIFQTSLKKYPFPGRGSALGRRRRRRWGYVFQNSLKNTQHFKYVWKYTKSCFQTNPKSDFSKFQCSMRDASSHYYTIILLLFSPKQCSRSSVIQQQNYINVDQAPASRELK